MTEAPTVERFSKAKLRWLRKSWSKPDNSPGRTWDFDGVYYSPDNFMSYDHEMREGLEGLGCKTFDQLVLSLTERLGRRPNVTDLMGGAYFLNFPEYAENLMGIRIHDKDKDFLDACIGDNGPLVSRIKKIIGAPNRRIVEADILSHVGWQKVRQAGMPLADLLICRPVGAFDNKHAMMSRLDRPETYICFYRSLFQRLLSLVDRTHGIVFTEAPDVYSDAEIRKFFEEFDKSEKSQSRVFTVPDEDYHWGGCKRRYAVVKFGREN